MYSGKFHFGEGYDIYRCAILRGSISLIYIENAVSGFFFEKRKGLPFICDRWRMDSIFEREMAFLARLTTILYYLFFCFLKKFFLPHPRFNPLLWGRHFVGTCFNSSLSTYPLSGPSSRALCWLFGEKGIFLRVNHFLGYIIHIKTSPLLADGDYTILLSSRIIFLDFRGEKKKTEK